jgi:DNA-binding LacI/PurR family transcriptional regulator
MAKREIDRKATMADVAARAGVSKATVSFVLGNNPNQSISAAVRERVFEAAKELSFHRRANAVALARGRSGNIALVLTGDLSTIANPFFAEVVEGVIDASLTHEYNLLFSVVGEGYRGAEDLPKAVREHNADGLILVSRVAPLLVQDVVRLGLPAIAIDPFPAVPKLHTLQADNYAGGRLAAEHLLALGHRRLAVLAAVVDRPSIADRWKGFRDALRAAKVPFDIEKDTWITDDLTPQHGSARGKELLASRRAPTGVFCVNDDLAAGLLQAGHELGYRIPDALSVVGFDDSPHAAKVYPPLTTITTDRDEMGRRGVEGLIRLIDGKSVAMQEKTPVRLVIRSSTSRQKSAPE